MAQLSDDCFAFVGPAFGEKFHLMLVMSDLAAADCISIVGYMFLHLKK
jgi:hypothetical protein